MAFKGRRIDKGDIISRGSKKHVVIYICKYGCLYDGIGLECQYKGNDDCPPHDYTRQSYCPGNDKKDGYDGACYAIQELSGYNKDHGIIMQDMEEPMANKEDIKLAVKICNSYAAIDDVVEVTMGYTSCADLVKLMSGNRTITGRVVDVDTDSIGLDCSTAYHCCKVCIRLCELKSIRVL